MDTLSDSKFFMIFSVVMGVLTVIAVAIALIANLVVSDDLYGKSTAKMEMSAARIAPIGNVSLASNPAAPVAETVAVAAVEAAPATPESLYTSACGACHNAGVAGAPLFGDASAWAGRIDKGLAALTTSAINGIGTMPARGGSALSDEEIESVVQYMLDAM